MRIVCFLRGGSGPPQEPECKTPSKPPLRRLTSARLAAQCAVPTGWDFFPHPVGTHICIASPRDRNDSKTKWAGRGKECALSFRGERILVDTTPSQRARGPHGGTGDAKRVAPKRREESRQSVAKGEGGLVCVLCLVPLPSQRRIRYSPYFDGPCSRKEARPPSTKTQALTPIFVSNPLPFCIFTSRFYCCHNKRNNILVHFSTTQVTQRHARGSTRQTRASK